MCLKVTHLLEGLLNRCEMRLAETQNYEGCKMARSAGHSARSSARELRSETCACCHLSHEINSQSQFSVHWFQLGLHFIYLKFTHGLS